jgi:hypothetical protein
MSVEYMCAQCTSFPTYVGYLFRWTLLYVCLPVSRCTSYRLFGHFTLYCELLKRIVQEGGGYTQLTVNDIFMANSTHYIAVSEKTVINSLITSVCLQPPSMNFYVIKNSAMRKNTWCGTALQVKLYELPVYQFGKQWGRFILTPNEGKWRSIAEGFNKHADFPNCVEAVDGKLIRIEKPERCGSLYVNYKHYCSIVFI